MVKILDAEGTAAALPYSALVPAVARAARELVTGQLNAPERLTVEIDSSSSLLCMPAVGRDISITKVVTVHRGNAARSLPAIQGEVSVFDSPTGRRLLMLDGPTVTMRRTAAVTLLGIELLAPIRPRSALLIGTGAQAQAHAEALLEHFGVTSFQIAGVDRKHAIAFTDKLQSKYPALSAEPSAASQLPPHGVDTDLVIALTTSCSPVIPPKCPDSTLVIGVGAYRPDMAEVPRELLRQRRVVVDYLKGAQLEAGDLLQAEVVWGEVLELGQMLEYPTRARQVPSVFKSVGHSSWDLAAARVVLESLGAARAGTG